MVTIVTLTKENTPIVVRSKPDQPDWWLCPWFRPNL